MQVNHVYCGDSAEVLKRFPDNSVDSVVTDPPYELGFMGKSWDRTGIASSVELWAEVFRVLKPGGHLLSFGGTRTYHRMASAIEDAGFEIRDQLQWLYGTGFPKNHDISKAIDREKGVKRERVRIPASEVRNPKSVNSGHGIDGGDRPWMQKAMEKGYHEKDGDTPATPEASQWDGWGTALKPANEPIALARKPLSERTIAANVLKLGTGGLNIDGSRIPTTEALQGGSRQIGDGVKYGLVNKDRSGDGGYTQNKAGRFPANVIFDEVAAAVLDEQTGDLGCNYSSGRKGRSGKRRDLLNGLGGQEGVDVQGYTDSGGASRFFYIAKASRRERTHNGQVDNKHPTVKPLKLMEYLIKLITPPGGIVLDPFCGSGSTLVAAKGLGFDYIGIDMSEEYVELSKQRLAVTPAKAEQAVMF